MAAPSGPPEPITGSPLARFYRGTGTDHAGRHLEQILGWDDEALEGVHDYIQWLFPNEEPSRANPFAPLVTADDRAAFRGDPAPRSTLRRCLDRLLRFYGFERIEVGGAVEIHRSGAWALRAANWLHAHNHNHLRLTRILKSLKLFGLELEARALQHVLVGLAEHSPRSVSRATARHWKAALD